VAVAEWIARLPWNLATRVRSPQRGVFLLLIKNPYSAKKLSKWRPEYVTFQVAYFKQKSRFVTATN